MKRDGKESNPPDPHEPEDLLARAFMEGGKGPDNFTRLVRYETAIERSIERGMKHLKVLQAARNAQRPAVPEAPAAPPNPPPPNRQTALTPMGFNELRSEASLVGFRPPMEMKMGTTAVNLSYQWMRAGEDGRFR